jgi:hypothetical protein
MRNLRFHVKFRFHVKGKEPEVEGKNFKFEPICEICGTRSQRTYV